MKSEYFHCPHCQSKLEKSAAAFVLGEAKNAVVMGSMAPFVTCPACGNPIDSQSMIEGKYDPPKTTWGDALLGLLWIGAIIYLVVECNFGFWTSLGIAISGLVLLEIAEYLWKKYR